MQASAAKTSKKAFNDVITTHYELREAYRPIHCDARVGSVLEAEEVTQQSVHTMGIPKVGQSSVQSLGSRI